MLTWCCGRLLALGRVAVGDAGCLTSPRGAAAEGQRATHRRYARGFWPISELSATAVALLCAGSSDVVRTLLRACGATAARTGGFGDTVVGSCGVVGAVAGAAA